MKKILSIVLAAVLLLMLAIPAAAVLQNEAAPAPHSAAFAAEVLRLTNVERARHNLPPLSGANSGLNSAAQRRAVEIATSFSHTRPNGSAWSTVLNEFPVGNRIASGENIARGQTTPAQVVAGWMASPGHRENILRPFTHLGVGVYRRGNTYHWAQLFINDGSIPFETGSSSFWRTALSWVFSAFQLILRVLSLGLIIWT